MAETTKTNQSEKPEDFTLGRILRKRVEDHVERTIQAEYERMSSRLVTALNQFTRAVEMDEVDCTRSMFITLYSINEPEFLNTLQESLSLIKRDVKRFCEREELTYTDIRWKNDNYGFYISW